MSINDDWLNILSLLSYKLVEAKHQLLLGQFSLLLWLVL